VALSKQRVHINANVPIKIISLALGYGLWALFNQMHPSTVTLSIPLCFYGETTAKRTLAAPETITVTLAGKRSDLARLDLETLAAHIDAATLVPGPNPITLTQAHLFLPATCNLVHCTPSNILVSLKEVATLA
jgi:hypothetical protein